ncbi:hypothetical protein SSP35_01_04330 [Streptomyces sp. NBRC 110611]|uniref:hypothetical protein n=1 Tax=Streptomyces sp. NBRC 110611 TaxID=1621259 RepID=UPI000832595E|nr:hypothetical protein [Streptomyces sp. NBRC 110611]GAU65096.1 hypothetical protein SSP35_01_04330 [Streptomyces sp. NBRC 110611]
MPSPSRPQTGRVPRTLLRVGLVISAAGAVAAAGSAATAGALPADKARALAHGNPTATTIAGLTEALVFTNPLSNTVETQVGDFQPISTKSLTGGL